MLTLGQLAEHVQGELVGDPALPVTGVSGYESAGPGQVTFVEGAHLLGQVESGPALAVIAPLSVASSTKPLIRVAAPRVAFARALALFAHIPTPAAGIHPTALVGRDCRLAPGCTLGPYVVLGAGVELGDQVTLHALVHLGDGVRIGAGSVLHSGVSVYHHVTLGSRVIVHSGTVIGGDGFGYVREGSCYQKIPQIGTVIVGDDVEIGANCAIDRATTDATVIGRGTKLDNLVQVGHNVRLGEDCVLAAQTGISGSCTIGNRVIIAGQVGIADHVTIGDDAMLTAQAGIIGDVEPGTMVSGYPARPHREQFRVYAASRKLPEALSELRSLRARLEALEALLDDRPPR
jgi:UDP-3-O-[3-hydroxymyristoyl] glucosamine N-acyltransferase